MITEQTDLAMASEKAQRKRIDAIYWAGVFIWAGLVFGADSLGALPQIGQAGAWSWIFAGAGLYALLGNIFRASAVDWPSPTMWDYTWAAILLIIGAGGFVSSVDVAFPIILVVMGVAVLVNTLLRD
jgi:hypothetical protein